MTEERIVRGGADRRSQSRGGRRDADLDGLAPLVMVVGGQADVGDAAGAVLAKLKFAVVPAATVGDALRILQTMRPDIIVVRSDDAARIRLEAPEHDAVVAVSGPMRADVQLLVDEIRTALRGNAATRYPA